MENISVGSYLLCPFPERSSSEKLLKILPHFQGPAWVLVLQSQKEQPWTKALGRHQRTSMTMLRSCRADCECGPGLWQCLCLGNPFKPCPAANPMSHLCLPAATAQMPQVPSLQTAVSGEAPTEAAFNLGWSLGDAGNGFVSLPASTVSLSGGAALNSH